MLQDPEQPSEEWEDTVWASSLDVARSKCEAIANEAGLTEVINVTQATKKLNKNGTYRFICWFKTEKSSYDDSNN